MLKGYLISTPSFQRQEDSPRKPEGLDGVTELGTSRLRSQTRFWLEVQGCYHIMNHTDASFRRGGQKDFNSRENSDPLYWLPLALC